MGEKYQPSYTAIYHENHDNDRNVKIPQSSIVALVSCGQTTTVEFDLKLTELDGTHAWYYKANEEPMDKRS